MKLSYQVATPEVRAEPGITSYQGDFESSLKALRSHGYDGVELMVRDPRLIDAGKLRVILDRYEYPVPMVCTGEVYGQDKLSFSDPDDTRRDEAVSRIKAAVDLAAFFKTQINLGRVRGGFLPGVDKKKTISRISEAVREAVEYAESKNVVVALEPVNTLALNFLNSTLESLEYVKEIDSPVFRLMLDTAHMHIEDKDIGDSVRRSIDFVTFVHFADSNRRYPGAGVFDFPAFIRLLKEAGYDEWVSVEAFPMPDQETALRKSAELIKPLLR